MDFLSVWYWSPCTAVLGALAITLLSILVTLAVRTRRLSSLPGPYSAWNILGSLYYIKTKGVVEYDTECKKKYGKLYGDWEGSLYTVFTTDVDIIREVFFKEARTFHSSLMQFYPSNELQKNALPFIYEYGRWKRVRSIVTPQFSSARLRQMTPFMKVSISNVINNFNTAADEGSSLDIKKMFGAYTMRLISSAGFGMDVDPANEPNHPFVRNAGDAISSFLGNPVTVLSSVFPLLRPIVRMLSPLNRVAPSVHYIDSVLTAAIDERRTNGQSGLKDILQSLIDARLPEDEVSAQEVTFGDITVKKTLSDVEIRGQSIAFFLAGYETTATTLTFMSYLLATNPDVQGRLCQEIDNVLKGTEPDYDSLHKLTYLEMCLHETMRLFPPILRLSRSASEDTSVKGYFIRRGTGISVPVYTLHHDPDYWPEPEKFDPERFAPGNREKIHPCAHMPFSAGPRHCVGKRMALVAAKMAMASVLQHVTFSPSQQTKTPVVLEKGNFMCAAEGGIVLDVKRRT